MKIGIIGSCGKKGMIRKVQLQNYNDMLQKALLDISKLSFNNSAAVTLISGGAALSDHVAVDLFLKGQKNTITAAEKQGYRLFIDYGCVACHQGVNMGGNLFGI